MNRLPARLGAAALLVSSVCFLLYPAIRPFSDETSLQGAAAFASSAWVTAHVLAMVAFICLVSGMLGVLLALAGLPAARRAFWTMQVMTVGVGLTLPFYGAETFGLRVIGQQAIQQNSAALVRLASLIRSGPGLVMFGAGLLLLAASGIMVAVLLWRSGGFPRWSGVPLGLGLTLYLPQFF